LIDTTRRYLEHGHKRVDEVGEVVLSESLDESSERLCGGCPRLRNRVDQYFPDEGHELREVRDEILRFRECRKVANDRGRLSLNIGRPFSETTVEDGNELVPSSRVSETL
jgi:hypothetical protein